MVKVVFLIMSGDQKMDLALRMAAASVANRRFEDLKIIFFGPSQERLLNLEGRLRRTSTTCLRMVQLTKWSSPAL